ncbi:hypothetical protein FIBSPDRAFT_969527 [Athelia psychrophila]|uniref:Uncharacterized protein n=1 Tax=Athelia psychrophila TaxID=1759441 RepID=A0A167T390_9AGAM|nr:hypothetical protein FIBSPDRAFT_969903 [Fibularhizoctonia sp. CBS 109695]KZP02874.1 hypothetical protein FIBSPDRAFT_969527 [Fibularhizoctonia sp. CBS 109695]
MPEEPYSPISFSSSNGPATATSPTTSTRSPAKSEAPPARSSTIQHLIPSIPATWNPFWALLASPPVDKLGRRFLFHMNRTGTSIFFLTQMICIQRYQARQTDAAAHGMIAFICLVYAAYDLAFTPLIVRCIFGILLYHPVQRHVNPIAPGTLGWKYCVCLLSSHLFFGSSGRLADPAAPSSQIVYAVFIYFNILKKKHLSLKEAVERLE